MITITCNNNNNDIITPFFVLSITNIVVSSYIEESIIKNVSYTNIFKYLYNERFFFY